jgi:hypothetical protein
MDDRALMQLALDALRMCNSETMYASQRLAINKLHDRLAKDMPTKIFGPNLENVFNNAGFYRRREWVGLESDEQILEISKEVWGRDKLNRGRDDHRPFYIDFARAIEAELKQKNT